MDSEMRDFEARFENKTKKYFKETWPELLCQMEVYLKFIFLFHTNYFDND
jgi:hypothetical protein